MKKILISVITAFALIVTVGCGSTGLQQFQDTNIDDIFDTVVTVSGFSASESDFNDINAEINEELMHYDQLFDIYDSYKGINNIKTINDNAGKKPVKVEQPIIDLLLLARDMNEATDGNVNVAMGSVLHYWHEAREYGLDHPDKAYLPEDSDLQEAAQHTDFSAVEIDEDASTVFISDPEVQLDVGAVAKGFATQAVADKLAKEDVDCFLLNAGGNVNCIGNKPDDEKWTVAVEGALGDKEDYSAILQLDGGLSAVTSGSYQRYYTVDGKKYHHIINPDTLYPDDTFASVTIISNDSGVGDALSTALFNMSFEEGKALIDSMDGFEAMWVLADGSIKSTEGFNDYIAEE